MPRQKFDLYLSNTPSGELPDFAQPLKGKDAYLPSEELAAAVNVALALGQPLLLTGQTGTGKTQLAYHVARYFGLHGPFVFTAQTSSVKKDLFYNYDALGHFHYAQKKEKSELGEEEMEQRFIRYQALGKAIKQAAEDKEKAKEGFKPKRSVVLIDEIDKAPRDFPNDLLVAIETLQFEVPEVPGVNLRAWQCPPELMPVIIITSNSEKNLPDAFLRRVVYHDIRFPDEKKLLEILEAKELLGFKKGELEALIEHFMGIRNGKNMDKQPATAELIAWASLLPRLKFPIEKLKPGSSLSKEESILLHSSYGVLAKNQDDLKKITGS